jgi:glycoside/pentoside/hexuronide:cation symporter, GPH family
MSNSPQKTDAPVRLSEKIGYGMGDSASNFFFHTFNIFLLSYYVDVFGLTAAAVGTMFLVTKLVDAFTDVFMGMVADRTKTRWGRFRPWILWMAIPYGIIGYSMFANPDLAGNGKLIYAYVTYSLMMLAYTAINVPYSSLLGVISPHSQERTSLSTYRFVMAFLAQLLISAFVIPLKNVLGGDNEALGYQLTMAIFAVLSIAMWFFTFASTRERVPVPSTQSTDLKGDLKVLLQNGPWIALVFCGLFTLMMVAVRGGATLFYMKYYAQVDQTPVFWIFDKTSLFFMSGTASMVVGACLHQGTHQTILQKDPHAFTLCHPRHNARTLLFHPSRNVLDHAAGKHTGHRRQWPHARDRLVHVCRCSRLR